ncbi:hypothetical protein Hdeb2414_s0041g00738691 [Helianthus debilis subsp. tardiflorus]
MGSNSQERHLIEACSSFDHELNGVNFNNSFLSKMSFSSLSFSQFWDFRPNVCFFASGSKRFEILPFSSGSLTPSIFSVKLGVFPSFLLT